MPETPSSSSTRTTGLDRRHLLKGIAWSTPVIAATFASPAHAASQGCVGTFTFSPTTLVGGQRRFVVVTTAASGGSYTSPLTITKTGGDSTAQVTLTLTGAGYSFPGFGATRVVDLVGGSITVQVAASSTAVTNGATLTARVTGVPGQTCAAATLPLGRRVLSISSTFGAGFYPNRRWSGSMPASVAGFYQFDADPRSVDPKSFNVINTSPGDVLSNISIEFGTSLNWPVLPFVRLDGSSTQWTVPVSANRTVVRDGTTFNLWRSTYTGADIVAAGSTTAIPIGMYFRQNGVTANSSTRGATNFTWRYVTVSGTPMRLEREVAEIINTNREAPTPANPNPSS
ncbi:hypothetical protein [Pseudoclavibacter sp. RFBB5]|uniref:hypothetical protein n=1 Tax=Pseudoclavibacter sp. RFBB5 TaxID=2080574 RepID=UPI0011B05F51|nr:hypothetical protein [Pseudoclavibacter sp. RFBB5]